MSDSFTIATPLTKFRPLQACFPCKWRTKARLINRIKDRGEQGCPAPLYHSKTRKKLKSRTKCTRTRDYVNKSSLELPNLLNNGRHTCTLHPGAVSNWPVHSLATWPWGMRNSVHISGAVVLNLPSNATLNTTLHVVVTPIIKLFSLLFHNGNFATAMNIM